ncbi:MAG: PilZ domain-containing protein [Terriglobales bacterium]
MEQWETFERGQSRAPRFTLELPLRYRRHGADEWEEGRLRNISRSGLFFSARQAYSVHTRIELTFTLPKVLRDEPPGLVCCQGQVARSVLSDTEGDRPAIAVRIRDYQFTQTPADPPVNGAEAGKR